MENLGKVTFSMSIISYFSLLAALGISTYAIREGSFIKDNINESKALANELFTLNTVSSIISFILLIVSLVVINFFVPYRFILLILSLIIVFSSIGVEWIFIIYENYVFFNN